MMSEVESVSQNQEKLQLPSNLRKKVSLATEIKDLTTKGGFDRREKQTFTMHKPKKWKKCMLLVYKP